MPDPLDNTFPMPATDDANSSAASAAQPAVNPQPAVLPTDPASYDPNAVSAQAVPQESFTPTQETAPVAPAWQDQASADAAQLPAGTDSYDVNAQPQQQPYVDPNAAAQPYAPAQPQQQPYVDPNAAPQPYMETPANTVYPEAQPAYDPNAIQPAPPIYPQAQTAIDPATGQPAQLLQQPIQPTQSAGAMGPQQEFSSVPSQYPQTLDSGPIPPGNTLDLSNQGAMAGSAAMTLPQDSAGQAYPDNPLAGPPVDFGLSSNALATDMVAQNTSGKKKSLKFIIIAVVVVVVIALVSLAAVLMSRNSNKPAVDLNDKKVDVTEQQTDTDTEKQGNSIPKDYQEVVRECFSFGVFMPTTVDFTKTVCQMAAKFGTVSQYSLTVTPVTDPVVDLQNLVDKAKAAGTITTQDDIQLGGVPSKKLVIKSNGLDQQTLVTIPTNKTYKIDGKNINAFIITTSYNDDVAKKASEVLIRTWIWI
ncbi:MAG: hypothetical protein NT114_01660 [Patescibacteria group bacterium]|nr:hypothetical protein [Patescibacteria group bacterium]